MLQTIKEFRYSIARTRFRAPLVWMRSRSISENDVLIASYPRAGSTWFNFVMYEILTGNNAKFGEVNTVIPYVGKHHRAPKLLPMSGRIIKTHELYRKEYKKAVYLVRDPRDVVVSEYYYMSWLGVYHKGFDRFFEQFLSGNANQFGSWTDHVNSWLDAAAEGKVDLHLVKYEEMRKHTYETLVGVVEFLNLPVDQKRIQASIENNALEKMREKEDQADSMMRTKGDSNLRFVREGTTEGGRQTLNAAQRRLVEQYAQGALRRLGYPVTS